MKTADKTCKSLEVQVVVSRLECELQSLFAWSQSLVIRGSKRGQSISLEWHLTSAWLECSESVFFLLFCRSSETG